MAILTAPVRPVQPSALLTLREACQLANASPNTIRAWCDSGKVLTRRTIGNQRRVVKASLEAALGIEPEEVNQGKRVVIYGRVSGRKQTTVNGEGQSDLTRQVERLRAYCRENYGRLDVEFVECGSGLSDSRPKFLALVKAIVSGEIGVVVVMYEDRLARFGTNLFKAICQQTGTKLVIVEEVNKEKSYEEELCEDLMAVTHVYSSRHYGRRGAEAKRVRFTDEAKARVKELFNLGFGATPIARTLKAEGLRCPKGRLYHPHVIRKALARIVAQRAELTEGDAVARFVHQRCQRGPNLKCWSDELHAAYSQWAEENSIPVLDRHQFARRVKTFGCTNYKSTQTKRRWKGICLAS